MNISALLNRFKCEHNYIIFLMTCLLEISNAMKYKKRKQETAWHISEREAGC